MKASERALALYVVPGWAGGQNAVTRTFLVDPPTMEVGSTTTRMFCRGNTDNVAVGIGESVVTDGDAVGEPLWASAEHPAAPITPINDAPAHAA
ncbi:hypothetical protein Aph01nite_74770 [Acrocarpospora phusangensis]|uniref:Uncharacterized protein n=1 Tax=Acrocarpospora phusangensis TaxID=1070424 RepID=A0A919QHQ8_9ACTN|nr:hypothetical protein Aph01nite_74770 [Acrocarpospora phusangensis]